MSEEFKKPKITINRVYTGKGDTGYTQLVGGKKVKKNTNRIKGFGEIDELNVVVGSCALLLNDVDEENKNKLFILILKIQNDLFNLGNMIATPSDDMVSKMPQITDKSIKYLEEKINLYNKELESLTSFVLPGGSELNIRFHYARVVCRRCERNIVGILDSERLDVLIIKYLNRLSDLFFILSRYANKIASKNELLWNPNFK